MFYLTCVNYNSALLTIRHYLKLINMKTILLAMSIFFFVEAKSQDTIKVKYVVLDNSLISRRTGETIKVFHKKKMVKLGYIIKHEDGLYTVNGKLLKLSKFKN